MTSEVLDFWTEFIQSYKDWIYESILLPSVSSSFTDFDQTFDGFCKSQKLAFCDYCEPMCEINQNCITDPIAVICEVVSATSMMVTDVGSHGTYWSLVHTCCNKCSNYQCNISVVDSASFVPSMEPPPEKNDHLLKILVPMVIVTILSVLAITAFCFRKKRKSIKYRPPCQFEILSESEVSAEAGDRTEISIIELWDQIKNKDDAKDSMKMKPTKNNAPLACVLRSSDTSDSEV